MYKSLVALLLIFSATALQAENNYSGFYLGATLGYGYVDGEDKATETVSSVNPDATSGSTSKTTPKGLSFSARGGYSWVLQNNILWGIEGDLEYRSANDRSNQFDPDGAVDPLLSIKTDLNYAASLRGRLGYLLKNDKTLLYATAGLAAANIKRTYFNSDNDNPAYQSSTNIQTGFTAGLGLEHSISDALSVLGEFRYADYGDKSLMSSPTFDENNEVVEKHEYTENSLQLALVYHF